MVLNRQLSGERGAFVNNGVGFAVWDRTEAISNRTETEVETDTKTDTTETTTTELNKTVTKW